MCLVWWHHHWHHPTLLSSNICRRVAHASHSLALGLTWNHTALVSRVSFLVCQMSQGLPLSSLASCPSSPHQSLIPTFAPHHHKLGPLMHQRNLQEVSHKSLLLCKISQYRNRCYTQCVLGFQGPWKTWVEPKWKGMKTQKKLLCTL